MDSTQTLILAEILLVPLSITSMSIGIHGLRYRTTHGSFRTQAGYLLSLLIGLLSVFFAVKILLSAPFFDFVDRCRPSGTGLIVRL
jgi:hypothetical protein